MRIDDMKPGPELDAELAKALGMSIYLEIQTCPYCGHDVDDSHAEWEEGTHTVECDRCEKEYSVTTHYKFLGFEVQKYCTECCAPEDECYCEVGEDTQP